MPQKLKKRGKLLTILLLLGSFGIITASLALFNTSIAQKAYGTLPNWYVPYLIFGFTMGIINLLGVWFWKKWSLYTLIVSTIIGVIMQLFLLLPLAPAIIPFGIISNIFGSCIWFWAIYRKWEHFE